ncbi:MAG: hypothetical protein ACRDCX_04675 [Aeromonas sp.]
MSVTEDILQIQLMCDEFSNKDAMVSGIARLAIDKGFSSLSPAQQNVLNPYLTQRCNGVTDPGEHHNDCNVELAGQDLLDAYQPDEEGNQGIDHLLCDGCRAEVFDHAQKLEKICRE